MQNKNEFTPEESLQLIQSMIDKTKNRYSDNSFYFLFWGWLVFACCIVEFILKVWLQYPYHYFVWFSMPAGAVVSVIYGARTAKKERVKTFIDDATDYLWIALSVAFFAVAFINGLSASITNPFSYYILLYAIGTFVTGGLIKFKPLIIGGSINFFLAVICSRFSFDHQLLVAATAILISYIIPGHLLRKQYQHQ